MSAEEIKRLRAQQEAQAMRIQKMEMEKQRQQYQSAPPEYEPPQNQYYEEEPPQYNQVDQQQILIDQLTSRITNNVLSTVQAHQGVQKTVDDRMQRLMDKYPAIREDDSVLTKVARDEVARISRENPSLSNDKATLYELAVETAAAKLGARPVNMQFDPNQDYTVSSSGVNPAQPSRKSGHNYLTPKILANFEVLAKNHPDFNLDPKTPQGQKNLAELNEYSERFRANVDESHLRFK